MKLKTIILCLNDIAHGEALAAAATALAGPFDARVVGLYVIPAVLILPTLGMVATPEVFDAHRTHFQEKESAVREAFEAAMGRSGLDCEFRSVEGATPEIGAEAARMARFADLVLASVPPYDEHVGSGLDLVESLIMTSGRPVLALPGRGATELRFDEIVAGWNGSRESARAIFDALPVLGLAKRVTVLTVGPARPGGADVAASLVRHGVNAMARTVAADDGKAGAVLMREADALGAGLIVMGAYGHSRFAEFVFGGATRDVLDRLDRPLLMSH